MTNPHESALKHAIYDFLRQHPGEEFHVSEIARAIGREKQEVQQICSRVMTPESARDAHWLGMAKVRNAVYMVKASAVAQPEPAPIPKSLPNLTQQFQEIADGYGLDDYWIFWRSHNFLATGWNEYTLTDHVMEMIREGKWKYYIYAFLAPLTPQGKEICDFTIINLDAWRKLDALGSVKPCRDHAVPGSSDHEYFTYRVSDLPTEAVIAKASAPREA
jgi:hypothetical protein